MSKPEPARSRTLLRRWIKHLYLWHWISSAICLPGFLMFAITGITLNNAGTFESTQPRETHYKATLPVALRQDLAAVPRSDGSPLPAAVRDWLGAAWQVTLPPAPVEWAGDGAAVALPRPGGDARLRIDLNSGRAEYEASDRGWVAYLDDLHKGRYAGPIWSWFIDAFGLGCLVFSVTGLLILKWHAASRPMAWPVTALGLAVPSVLALFYIH